MYIPYNPNPMNLNTSDCVIRAIAKALDVPWEQSYMLLCLKGLEMNDLPNANSVWGSLLRDNGYVREIIPNTCPDCYTIEDFCKDNPTGTYVIGTGTHAVTAIDGNWYDAWNSAKQIPIYVYRRA